MCLSLPMRIVAVVDRTARTVRIAPDAAVADDRAAEEIVSAALLVEDEAGLDALVGGWGVAHCGFLLQRLSEDDARSRLDCFVAMDAAAGVVAEGALGLEDGAAKDRAPRPLATAWEPSATRRSLYQSQDDASNEKC